MDKFLEILDKASTPHDGAFRFGFGDSRVARQFFTTYLPPSVLRHLDLNCLETENKSFIDEQFRQRHSDMIYKTRLKGETAFLYLIFEHQSSPDQMMIYRLFGYMNNFWKQYESQHADITALPMVLPLVFYHGSQKWNAPKRFCDILVGYTEDFAPFTPDFSYMLFDLSDYGKDIFRQSADALLHLVLMQFKHIFDDDIDELVEIMSGLLNQIEESNSFDTFGRWVFTYIYSARSESTETLIENASRAIHKTKNKKLWGIAMTAAEQWRQKMKDEGRREGRREGRTVGQVEGMSLILINLLNERFDNLPPLLRTRLERADTETLNKFGKSLLRFNSLQEAENWWQDN